jgi:hypothetical protein
MAAWNRKQIGKITKKSEDRLRFKKIVDAQGNVIQKEVPEFSIQFTEDVSFKKGEYVNLENKAFKLASIEASREKMSEEVYEKALERVHKTPDFVFFEIIKVSKE